MVIGENLQRYVFSDLKRDHHSYVTVQGVEKCSCLSQSAIRLILTDFAESAGETDSLNCSHALASDSNFTSQRLSTRKDNMHLANGKRVLIVV